MMIDWSQPVADKEGNEYRVLAPDLTAGQCIAPLCGCGHDKPDPAGIELTPSD